MPSNVPVSGLSQLGSVLLDASQNYARNKRQDELLDRQRAQQLQDVAAQRAYSDKVRSEERGARIQDETAMAIIRQGMALKTALINEGLLNPADANNPDAVQSAYAQFQQRGLEKLYQELIMTPGADGKPLLAPEDVLNPALVAEAKSKLGAVKAEQLKFTMDQRGNAQATVNDLQGQLAQIRQQKDAISKSIAEPAPQYRPNSPEVMQLASQLAEQAKPGSGRNREAVAAMVPMAQKQLNDQSLLQHAQQVQAARAELDSLRYSEVQLTNSLERAMGTFKVAPSPGQTAAVLQNPVSAAPAPRAATAQDITAALSKLTGKPAAQSTSAGAPALPSILDNPTDNPVITAGNEEIKRRGAAMLQTQIDDAVREGQQIDQALASAAAPQQSYFTAGPGGGRPTPLTVSPDPVNAAQFTSDLLKRKAANDAKVQSLRAQLQGPTAAAVTPPAINTSTYSTPAPAFAMPSAPAIPNWWQSMTPPDDR